jgi:hypothetical protein
VRASDPRQIVDAVRDLTINDRQDHSCGMVDEVEVAEVEPGIWELQALLVGRGAWRHRKPRALTRWLASDHVVRIDAADVASVTTIVRLLKRADELGLAVTERRLLGWFERNLAKPRS